MLRGLISSYLQNPLIQSQVEFCRTPDQSPQYLPNKISNRQAKEIFDEYLETDVNADTFIEKKGLVQISNESEIEGLVEKVLMENPKMLEQYKSGKEKLFGFFVGQVMKLSNGKANPKMVNETLKRKLSP